MARRSTAHRPRLRQFPAWAREDPTAGFAHGEPLSAPNDSPTCAC